MTLLRKYDCLCGHDPNLGSLKDYLGNPEEVNHEHYFLDVLK